METKKPVFLLLGHIPNKQNLQSEDKINVSIDLLETKYVFTLTVNYEAAIILKKPCSLFLRCGTTGACINPIIYLVPTEFLIDSFSYFTFQTLPEEKLITFMWSFLDPAVDSKQQTNVELISKRKDFLKWSTQ